MKRVLIALLLSPMLLSAQIIPPYRINSADVTVDLDAMGGSAALWSNGIFTDDILIAVIWVEECNRYVALPNSATGSVVWLSTDGKFWTSVPSAQSNNWQDLTYSSSLNRLVAVSFTGVNQVQTSDNCGLNWTTRTAAESNGWLSVTWSASLELFVAVTSAAATNQVMTSPDGITWTSRAEAEANTWNDVVWAPELTLFVATASGGAGGPNRAMSSPNGTAWTARALSSASPWNGLTWAASLGLFVAVAQEATDPRVATSSDGITWTTQTAPIGFWNAVTYAPELNLLVAVSGTDPSVSEKIMTSSDGVTWTAQKPLRLGDEGASWGDVVWSASRREFLAVARAVGNNDPRVMISSAAIEGMVYTTTVTGQSWVTAESLILCAPFGTSSDGLTPETVFASGVQAIASNRIAGTGFDLSVYTPHGATGTYRFHCTGS